MSNGPRLEPQLPTIAGIHNLEQIGNRWIVSVGVSGNRAGRPRDTGARITIGQGDTRAAALLDAGAWCYWFWRQLTVDLLEPENRP